MLAMYEELCQMHYTAIVISSTPPAKSCFSNEKTGGINDLTETIQ